MNQNEIRPTNNHLEELGVNPEKGSIETMDSAYEQVGKDLMDVANQLFRESLNVVDEDKKKEFQELATRVLATKEYLKATVKQLDGEGKLQVPISNFSDYCKYIESQVNLLGLSQQDEDNVIPIRFQQLR